MVRKASPGYLDVLRTSKGWLFEQRKSFESCPAHVGQLLTDGIFKAGALKTRLMETRSYRWVKIVAHDIHVVEERRNYPERLWNPIQVKDWRHQSGVRRSWKKERKFEVSEEELG